MGSRERRMAGVEKKEVERGGEVETRNGCDFLLMQFLIHLSDEPFRQRVCMDKAILVSVPQKDLANYLDVHRCHPNLLSGRVGFESKAKWRNRLLASCSWNGVPDVQRFIHGWIYSPIGCIVYLELGLR